MHTYFRAIGFSEPMKNLDRLNLMDDIMHKASQRAYTNIRHIESSTPETESMRTEFSLDLGEGYGITLVGEYDEDEEFIYEDMFPYMFNGHISTMEEITVEPRMDGYSYLGICDDLKLGVTLIFRLRNTVDFLKNGGMTGEQQPGTSAALSALSVEGTVMLPIRKTEKEMQMVRSQAVRRKKLMTAARTGDENAMKESSSRRISILWSIPPLCLPVWNVIYTTFLVRSYTAG